MFYLSKAQKFVDIYLPSWKYYLPCSDYSYDVKKLKHLIGRHFMKITDKTCHVVILQKTEDNTDGTPPTHHTQRQHKFWKITSFLKLFIQQYELMNRVASMLEFTTEVKTFYGIYKWSGSCNFWPKKGGGVRSFEMKILGKFLVNSLVQKQLPNKYIYRNLYKCFSLFILSFCSVFCLASFLFYFIWFFESKE